ncbi:MAG: hypothetical protein ACIWVG_03095 [Gloeotrichia echinulata HAB0833]
MSRRFSSTISSVMHCRPKQGLGRAIVLFAFEGRTYRFNCADKSTNVGVLGAIAEWLNPEQLKESGRCNCCLAPI